MIQGKGDPMNFCNRVVREEREVVVVGVEGGEMTQ